MKHLALAVLTAFLLASCTNYGKRVTVEKSEVFYKGDGVTEGEAKSLGAFLLQNELFNKEKESSAQLTKDSGTYFVRLVYDSAKKDPAFRLYMWKLQNDLSKGVFNGSPARFVLTDNKFENGVTLPPVNAHSFGKATVYYDSNAIPSSAIDDLSDFLKKQGLVSGDQDATVLVQQEGAQPVIHIVYNKEYYNANTQQVASVMGYLQYLLQNNYPPFKDAGIWLTTKEFVDYQKIATLSKDQVAQIEAAAGTQPPTGAPPTGSTQAQQQ